MPQRLDELLQECTVKITIPDQSGWGTGFFVAPGLILTCAHVVKRSPGQVQVGWQNKTLNAVVERSIPEPYDLALLRVMLGADANLPCVWLDEEVQPRDPLYLFGYPDEGDRQGEPRTFNCDGVTGSDVAAILFNLGQVRPGMSGSPLLNQRTGKVCGMVKFTRDRSIDLGGGAIPSRVILKQLPQLRDIQQQLHQQDLRWAKLLPEMTSESSRIVCGDVVAGDKVGRDKIGTQNNYYYIQETGNPTSDKPSKLSETVFQCYREAVICHYSQQRHLYAPTDALLPLEARSVERKAQEGKQNQPPEEAVEPFPVLEGLWKYALGTKREHVLLAGRPGSGKTTTLQQLAVSLAEEGQVPVLVQLKSDHSVVELIQVEFRRRKQRVTPDQINDWLFAERLVLLLDGVNEIPNDDLRRSLIQFREGNLTVPMIFTTRDLSLGCDLGIGKRLEMRPLSEPQMHEFVSKYLPGQGEHLLEQLRDRLRELAETPLLLKLLCDVFDPETKQIPQNRGELFQWFDRDYKRIKKEIEYVPVSENFWEFKSEILQYLAFSMIHSEVQPANFQKPSEPWLTVHKSRAEEILETWLHQRGVINAPTKAKLWLKDLCNHHLLQDAAKPEEIEFHHQLFQEYYAAEYLLRLLPGLSDEQLKRDYLNLLKWTEPIALMLSLLDKEEQALRVVKLAIDDVDLILGARLVGAASMDVQKYILDYICKPRFPRKLNFSLSNKKRCLDTPDWLKIKVLKKTQSTYTFTYLRILLRNAHPATRVKAIHALGQLDIDSQEIDSQEVVEELSMLQQDPDNLVREAANHTLKSFQFKRSLTQEIISDLNKLRFDGWKNDQNNLISSKNERNEFQESQWLETLKGYSKGSDPDLRRDAVYTISQQGLTDLLPELFSMMDDPSPEARRNIAKAFGTFRVKESVDQLTQFLDDDDFYVVANSCEALGKLGDSVVVPKLLKILADNFNILSDESLTITAEVCKSLGRLGGNLAMTELSRVLMEHQVFWMREIAARSLGEISDTNSVKYLAYALKTDKSECVKWEAAKSLAHLGSLESVQFLSDGLDDFRQDRRREAIKSLGKLKPSSIHLLAVKALEDPDIIVSDIATRILVERESQELIPKVINLLKHQDSDIRWKAGWVLKHYETTSLVKFLSELIKTVYSELGEQAHDLVQHIQSSPGCQFYNYTVKQKKVRGNTKRLNDRLIEYRQNSSIRLLTQIDKTTQTISQKVEKMADEPRIENNINISGSPNSPINAPIGTSGVTQSKVTVSNSDPREGINWNILLAVFGIFVAIAAMPVSMTVSGAFNEEFRQWFKQIFPAQIEQEPEYLED